MIDPSTHPASLLIVRQSFQFKMFGSKRLKHLDRTIDVASEIWNHSVALKNRYFKIFGKGLPKSRHIWPSFDGHNSRTGSRSTLRVFKPSLTGSTLHGRRSSKATSNARQLFASAANIDRSHSSNPDTKFSDMGASRS
jgi:hypothetical protein